LNAEVPRLAKGRSWLHLAVQVLAKTCQPTAFEHAPLSRLVPFLGLSIRRVGPFLIAYRPQTADEPVIDHSFENDIFFAWVPEYTPLSGHTIIDVGAHIGDFALLAARKVHPGTVYAIEPSSDNCRILSINVLLNAAKNVIVERLALAATDGTARLYHYEDPSETWAHTITSRLDFAHEAVRTETLASFLQRRNISRVHFAKFNCEGAEFPILMSASPGILGRFDVMLVLYHVDLVAGFRLTDLLEHLRASGFATRIRDTEEERGWILAIKSDAAR
jgi:FkbM family methyltransferase